MKKTKKQLATFFISYVPFIKSFIYKFISNTVRLFYNSLVNLYFIREKKKIWIKNQKKFNILTPTHNKNNTY